MTREEYLKELNKAFGDFKFFEDDHHYEYKGQRVGISVTRLIEEYTNEFDAEAIAEKVAENNLKKHQEAEKNIKLFPSMDENAWAYESELDKYFEWLKLPTTIQEVLDEWKEKNEWSCKKGSLTHYFAQLMWKEPYTGFIPIGLNKEQYDIIFKLQRQAATFKKDYEDRLEHIYDEYVIGSEEYDIASAIDHLFINKLTGGLVLVDYKTNSDIHKNEKYAKNMKVPLSHLKDTTLNHYAIQLSIYKYLVEKYTNLKIEEFFIVYMSENIENYEIIDVPYLEKEVIKILENRRIKKMKSVPVLLIGKSGSGKSASLRNFKKDEIAIANVLGKPLPFKNDLNAPKVDDYNIILKAIQTTDKKVIVIDDANYLITNEFMNKSSVKGFDKYNEMGNNFFNLINGIKNVDGGKTVYLIMHEDTDEEGNVKPKTIGKLLDDKVNIQGMFTICIRAMYDNGNYIFRLKTNGQDCVKTPIGLFEEEQIENDLKLVDEKIREYYELDKEEKKDEEK